MIQNLFSKNIFSSSSTNNLIVSSLKCNDCRKHDGLFQCYHCNQRLCIHCCNKHYKQVTNEFEHLNKLTDNLLMKIFYIKTDLENQKSQTIEQCQKWRIDTINKINQAHTLIIQTIQDEYDILNKEYEIFIDKEMSNININKNELFKIKKENFKTSMDIIKEHIEKFVKYIDNKGQFSFQVKLPTFNIDENLLVESRYGNYTRNTNTTCKNDDRSSIEKDEELSSDHYDSTYGTASSSLTNSLQNLSEIYSPIPRRHTLSSNDSVHETNGILQRRLSIQSSSSNKYPWLHYRARSIPSFIE